MPKTRESWSCASASIFEIASSHGVSALHLLVCVDQSFIELRRRHMPCVRVCELARLSLCVQMCAGMQAYSLAFVWGFD
jgi:hypothetical protein